MVAEQARLTRPHIPGSAFKRTQKELNWKSVGKKKRKRSRLVKKGSNVFTVVWRKGIHGDPPFQNPENCFAPMCREMQKTRQAARSDQTGKTLSPRPTKNTIKNKKKGTITNKRKKPKYSQKFCGTATRIEF